ncbi:MAG: NTP transferase domain-containing protein [Vulcanimicrobiaceae bacterium]
MHVVVLAGGPPDAVAALAAGIPNKAFLPIGGIPLVERVLQALRATPGIEKIIVVAPATAHAEPCLSLADELRADGRQIRTSLRNGLEGLPPDEIVLLTASDLPLLTPEVVEDFISRVRSDEADLWYGCVEKRVHLAAYPQVPHTWARLREGTFCGGGLMALRPRVFPALERSIERLGAARKNPFRLASLFGYDVLLRFALGRLRIDQAQARAGVILGAPVRAVVSPYAQSAVNVDRVSDVALAERLLR